jgi:hypothetical protein
MRRLALALSLSLSLVSLAACGGNKDVAQATAPTCAPSAVTTTASAVITPVSSATIAPPVDVKTTPAVKPVAAKTDSTATARKLSITRIAIARDVKNREPIDVGTRFDNTEPKVFVYLDVHNTEKVPGVLYVEFVSPKAGAKGDIELSVGATDHWRTWAFTRLAKDPGTWKARIKNDRGEVIAEESFEVFSVD